MLLSAILYQIEFAEFVQLILIIQCLRKNTDASNIATKLIKYMNQ